MRFTVQIRLLCIAVTMAAAMVLLPVCPAVVAQDSGKSEKTGGKGPEKRDKPADIPDPGAVGKASGKASGKDGKDGSREGNPDRSADRARDQIADNLADKLADKIADKVREVLDRYVNALGGVAATRNVISFRAEGEY
ncbi:MAG: hypothetical protein ACKV2V_28785, partial [Blastocatellia bacterium]